MRNIIVLTISTLLLGTVLMGQITGSAHDFSGETSWNSSGEICITCHTPHNANASVEPLWNHVVTTTTFTLYSSSTFNASTIGQPTGASKLCLSCHDGTVAIDSYGGTTGSTSMGAVDANLGTDLSNDHPISFTYDSGLVTADGGLYDPATTTAVSDLLIGGQVQCASCHDVHNGSGYDNLLVIDNVGSALCLTCHNK